MPIIKPENNNKSLWDIYAVSTLVKMSSNGRQNSAHKLHERKVAISFLNEMGKMKPGERNGCVNDLSNTAEAILKQKI